MYTAASGHHVTLYDPLHSTGTLFTSSAVASASASSIGFRSVLLSSVLMASDSP